MTGIGSWSGVDFSVRQGGQNDLPRWRSAGNYKKRPIPFGVGEQTQFTGSLNRTLTVDAIFYSQGDLDTIQGACESGTSASLSYLGDSYSDTRLISVDATRRYALSSPSVAFATLTFDRVPT